MEKTNMDNPYRGPKDLFATLEADDNLIKRQLTATPIERSRPIQDLYVWNISLIRVGVKVETDFRSGIPLYSNLLFINRKVFVQGVTISPNYAGFMELYNLILDFKHKGITETLASGVPDWFKDKAAKPLHQVLMIDLSKWY